MYIEAMFGQPVVVIDWLAPESKTRAKKSDKSGHDDDVYVRA